MVDLRIFREVGDGIRTPIRVQALRGGTVSEVSQFLTDLNEAYSSLERFDSAVACSPSAPMAQKWGCELRSDLVSS